MDDPIVPRKKIDDFFFFGISDEMKQNLFQFHLLKKSFSQTIIGPKNNVQKEIEEKWKMFE
jgi:hypothetical protein